jgi:hypothetical protein
LQKAGRLDKEILEHSSINTSLNFMYCLNTISPILIT